MPSKTCSNNAVGFIFRTLQQRSLFFLFLPVFGPIAGALSRGWPNKSLITIFMGFYGKIYSPWTWVIHANFLLHFFVPLNFVRSHQQPKSWIHSTSNHPFQIF